MRRRLNWLSPGDPLQRTGGYIYNQRLAEALSAAGWEVYVHALPGTWPLPGDNELRRCREMCRALEWGSVLIADGLVWPGLANLRQELRTSHTTVVIVHSLLSKEFPANANELDKIESQSLQEAHGLICTSVSMKQELASLSSSRHTPTKVVCPGVDQAAKARGSHGKALLCVSNVIPRKGIRDLLQAVALLNVNDWTLDIAGSLQRDSQYASRVAEDVKMLGLEDKVRLHGELAADELDALYDKSDVLVHAAHFEAFGMSLTEAAARCIPIISTPAGALDYLRAGTFLEVPAGDIVTLAAKIETLLVDGKAQAGMRAAAAKSDLASWNLTVKRFESAIDEIASANIGQAGG